MLSDADVDELTFPDGEIVSAGFYTVDEARALVKPLLADRIAVALEAIGDGTTALCDHGNRVG